MTGQRKILTWPRAERQEWERIVTPQLQHCPGALDRPDAEMRDFFVVALDLDEAEQLAVAGVVAETGLLPPEKARGRSRFSLSRLLLARWDNTHVREVLLKFSRDMHRSFLEPIRQAPANLRVRVHEQLPPLQVAWTVAQVRDEACVAEMLSSLSPAQAQVYRGQLAVARRAFYYHVLHPAALFERQRLRGLERQRRRLARRLRQRQVRFRSLQVDLHTLRRDRKAWRRRALTAIETLDEQLAAATAEAAELRRTEAAAEATHRQALAELARHYDALLAERRAELAAALADYAGALAAGAAWAAAPPLGGRTVAVVGDEAHAAGYRALIEAAGGRLVHVSGVEKFGRIGRAVAGAHFVIVITDRVKHTAEHLVRKALRRSGAPVLHCPTSGLAALARLLRDEVLPRLPASGRVSM